MMKKKQYYEKEMACSNCKKKIKPLLEKNNINFGFGSFPGAIGRVGSGLIEGKKYLLVCPNCKAIIGTK